MSFTWNNQMLPDLKQAVGRGILGWAGLVEAKAVDLITSPPKTGKIYRRRGVEHQASAAGEAPASDTGRLANSGVVELLPDSETARVTFRTEYAVHLELGTKNMEPRPFLFRAADESFDEGYDFLLTEIRSTFL